MIGMLLISGCLEHDFVCSQAAARTLASLCSMYASLFCSEYSSRVPWLLQWLSNGNEVIRWSISDVLGTAVLALPSASSVIASGSSSAVTVEALLDTLIGLASKDAGARFIATKHGAIVGLGHVVACLLKRGGAAAISGIPAAVSILFDSLSHDDLYVREAAAASLTNACRAAVLPVPELAEDATVSACACVRDIVW